MPKTFNINEVHMKREYLIKDFLAQRTLNNIISQAGVGKSRLGFQLAIDIATGHDFLGLKTKQAKVLIIDQDQSEDESNEMVSLCLAAYKLKTHPNISTAFMETREDGTSCYYLKDNSLVNVINESDAEFILVDSLTSVCNGLNMNDSNHMQKFKELYQLCIPKNKTIVFLHHISEHKLLTFDTAMSEDPSSWGMYSSVINGAIDAYFILYNPNKGKDISKLFIRPYVKRYKIGVGIVQTSQTETENSYHFEDCVKLDINQEDFLTEDEQLVLNFFIESPTAHFINEINSALQGLMGINQIGKVAKSLVSKNRINLTKLGANKFKYELNKEFKNIEKEILL